MLHPKELQNSPNRFIILILVFCFSGTLFSQTNGWVWAKLYGGPASPGLGNEPNGITTDAQGNSYVVGSYTGNLAFNGNALPVPSPTCQGQPFIVKYDPNGSFVWAKSVKLTWPNVVDGAFGNASGVAMSGDGSGDIFVTGWFAGDADFGSASTVLTRRPSIGPANKIITQTDGFVAKYDSNGNIIWTADLGRVSDLNPINPNHNPDNSILPSSIASDQSGNCYVAGSYNDQALIGSIALPTTTVQAPFIAKYTASGTVAWANSIVTNGIAFGVAADNSGNCFVAGTFSSPTILFKPGLLLSNAATNKGNMFVASLNQATGNVTWAKQSLSSGGFVNGAGASSVACDYKGGCFITGSVEGTVRFDPSNIFIIPNGNDYFVASYNAQGTLLWIDVDGQNGKPSSKGICYNSISEKVYVVGTLQGNCLFNHSTVSYVSANPSDWMSFIAGYNSLGLFQFANTAVGSGSNIGTVGGIATGVSGHNSDGVAYDPIYITGEGSVSGVSNTEDFYFSLNGPVEISLPAGPSLLDCYLAKYQVYRSKRPIEIGQNLGSKADDQELVLYPNPSAGAFTVQLTTDVDGLEKMELFNLLGELVYSESQETQSGQNFLKINVSILPSGVYFLKITNGGDSIIKKIIIKK